MRLQIRRYRRPRKTAGKESLIMLSGDCSLEWLARIMSPSLLGGEVAVFFDPNTKDVYPIRLNSAGTRQLAEC